MAQISFKHVKGEPIHHGTLHGYVRDWYLISGEGNCGEGDCGAGRVNGNQME